MRLKNRQNELLKATLDELYHQYLNDYHQSPEDFFKTRRDPILFPHRYHTFHDREVAAFLAATFAYGNVTSLCAFIDYLLELMGPSPHAFLMQGRSAFARLKRHVPYYRLHKTQEILTLLSMLNIVYQKHGSLYEIFLSTYDNNSTM